MENNEMLPVVDPEGNVLRSVLRSECHNGSKLLHPGVHLHDSEASEEIGFPAEGLNKAEEIDRYVFESAIERELVSCNIAPAPDGFTPRVETGEADEVRYWPLTEIKEAIGRGVLTPNLELEFTERIYPYLRKRYGFE